MSNWMSQVDSVTLNSPRFGASVGSRARAQATFSGGSSQIPTLPSRTSADTFFQLTSHVDAYFKRNWLKSSNPVVRLIGKPLHEVTRAFSDHDYSRMFSIKGLGRVGVIPPLGSIATIVIPVTLAGRVFCSYRRSTDVDNRELGDVLRRDLPTLAILVYMLDPLVNASSHMLQRRKGLQLMTTLKDAQAGQGFLGRILAGFQTSAHPMSYTQLDRYYTLNSPARLAAIVSEKFNHPGLMGALKSFGKYSMTPEESALFNRFKGQFEHALRTGKRQVLKENSPVIQQLFATLGDFDKLASHAKQPLKIRQFVADAAKRTRHISAFTGLAIIVGLLGFGVTKFNEWWSVYQFKRMLADQKRQSPHQHKAG